MSDISSAASASTPSTTSTRLVYDLIARVMEISFEDNDYGLLFHCSAVNWEFNRAASRMLYWRVVLAPPFRGPVIDLRDAGAIPRSSNFDSACLPKYAPYVLALEIGGYISPRPPPRNTLPDKIAAALPAFVNLTCVTFTPATYHASLFDKSIPLLHGLSQLTELCVNASCTDDDRSPALVGLGGLRKLTLVSPGRTILQLLPNWLGKLSGSLTELHLKDNCGSVTPGVLKSFLPHVETTLKGLTLGLSYSLTNQDVFDFLSQLTVLKHLHLRYYWAQQQLKYPERLHNLLSLRSFTATYPAISTREEADRLDKWVRWVIGGSPNLQAIHLKSEDSSGAYISHDALIDHVVRKHARSLRVLDFENAYVRVDKLASLLEECSSLEEISVQVSRNGLILFAKHSVDLNRLRSVSFRVSNAPRRFQVDDVQATDIMEKYQPSLRRLHVNGTQWETSYNNNVDADQKSSFVARRTKVSVPPWVRKPSE